MKANSFMKSIALFGVLFVPASLNALEVHEWGTFTVLVSADGTEANWYQPYSDITELPTFTMNMIAAKSGLGPVRVRMETPVIYFYPEKETNLNVSVMFENGVITERFPAAMDLKHQNPLAQKITNDPSLITLPKSFPEPAKPASERLFDLKMETLKREAAPVVTSWRGKLLPPDHPNAKLIPSVEGEAGEHYGAAREVPNAWLFHSDSPVFKINGKPDVHPVDKFIFYRGAGQEAPPYHVTMSDEKTLSLLNKGDSVNEFQVALRVKDGRATWVQLPSVPAPSTSMDNKVSVTLPDKTISLEQADKELSVLFETALISHGLSKDEAKAMIKTWNKTWFNEPGLRVFTIVNPNWVDQTLPLAIEPAPQKIERVFVARYEILSKEREAKLASLLAEEKPTEETATRFKALELGRFANGAVEIVAQNEMNKMRSRFGSLSEIGTKEGR